MVRKGNRNFIMEVVIFLRPAGPLLKTKASRAFNSITDIRKCKLGNAIMRTSFFLAPLMLFCFSCFFSCNSNSSHEEMIQLLDKQRSKYNQLDNYYASETQVLYYDSLIKATTSQQDKMLMTFNKCYALIASGHEEEAIPLLEEQVSKIDKEGIRGMNKLKVQLALAYLRAGERTNCIMNHTGETCILPIQGSGVHKNQEGSRNAIRIYQQLLQE